MSIRYFGLRADEFLTDSSRTKFNVGAGRPPLAYVKPVILRVKRIKYILQRKTLAAVQFVDESTTRVDPDALTNGIDVALTRL